MPNTQRLLPVLKTWLSSVSTAPLLGELHGLNIPQVRDLTPLSLLCR